MSLKDEILKDIDDVFLNLEEFGETHTIDGKPVMCMFDDDALKIRSGSNELSVSESSLLLFAKESDLPRKVVGDDLLIDGRIYIYYKNITDGVYDDGVTYRAYVDGLEKGKTAQIRTQHYLKDSSHILFVTYAE